MIAWKRKSKEIRKILDSLFFFFLNLKKRRNKKKDKTQKIYKIYIDKKKILYYNQTKVCDIRNKDFDNKIHI